MAYRSNLSNLIADAFAHREGEATASARKWRATRMGNYVGVEHHATHMFNVTRGGVVEPVDPGYGGQSDTAGVRKITSGYGCVGTDCGVAHKELFYDKPETRGGYRRLEGSQWRNAIQRDPELRVSPPGRSVRMETGRRWPGAPRGPRSEGLGWEAHTQSGLAADRFSYNDQNPVGPNYDEPDPFDFSNPEEASQAQNIADMEATLQDFDERDQATREWRRSEQ